MSLPPYYRPSTQVQVEFEASPTSVATPQVACVIGPLYQVLDVNDSGDRQLLGLGTYNPDADTTFNYPSLPTAAKVDLSSVALRLENILAKYATLSGTGVIKRGSKANRIAIASGNGFKKFTNGAGTVFNRNTVFKVRDVAIGDRVKITKGEVSQTSRITGFINDIVAATTGAPDATKNRATQAYSGAAVVTTSQGTDHAVAINTGVSQYVGDITVPVVNDVYVLECITAGAAGIKQLETATVLGTVGAGGAGNATVVVTSVFLTGSPITLSVAVANNDTASQVATKIRTALNANNTITAVFTVGGTGAAVTLTKNLPTANDSTLNISIDNGTCSGLTAAPTSTGTTAGALGVAKFKVTSTNGDNVAEVGTDNVAFGTSFAIGTRGLYGSITSAGSQAFIVGEQFTFTVVAAYNRSGPVLVSDSGDYTGPFNTVYKLEVVKGGTWDTEPQISITTNTGIDAATPQIIAYNTSFLVGGLGIIAKFDNNQAGAQNGLVQGDVFYITATASQKGAIKTVTIANPIDSSIQEGDDLSVDFHIFKSSFDMPTRGYPEFASVALTATTNSFTVSGGITIEDSTWLENDGVTLAELDVVAADMLVSYRALLTTTAGVLSSLSDIDSIEAVLGKTTSDNPLGMGVKYALLNSSGQPVFFLPVKSDDVTGFTAALTALERDQRTYFRVPTSLDPEVLAVVTAHINAQSSPLRGNECYGVYGAVNDTILSLYDKKTNGDAWTGYVAVAPGSNPAVYTLVNIPGATLLLNGVRAGDEFRSNFGVDAFGNVTYDSGTVDEVIDEENLVLVSPGFSSAVGDEDTLQRVQIVRLLTLDEQASTLSEQSASYANRHVSNVFQTLGTTLPMYAFSAAVAGFASSVAPHQPITEFTLNGFNDETVAPPGFTPDQLDAIAFGGTLIITKSEGDGQVFIRHQLTTDRQDDRRAEMSVTRNSDSISQILRASIAPLRGKYNTSPDYYQLLDVTLRDRLNYLTNTKVTPSAGSQIVSWDQASLIIAQDPNAKTLTVIEVEVALPLPNNRQLLKLKISA